MSTSKQKPSGFTVTDRRSFASSGEAREPSESPPAEPPAAGAPPAGEAARARALPPVDFGTFVLSLGSSAIMHLGELAPEEGGAPKKDLTLAKHTIDIL